MPQKLPFDVRLRLLGRQLAVAAAALALVTCTDNPTGPSIGGTVHLAVSPRFKSSVVLSPALPIDEARLVVYRPLVCDCTPDSVAGAQVPFALNQDSIRMQLSFKLEQSPETLQVQFQLLGQGQILFQGDTTVIIRAGVAAQVPPVTVSYTGPGSDIAVLNIFPRDTVLTFGDSLQFSASGTNALAQLETAFYLSWSSSLTQAKIRPDGLIHAPSQRLTAHIKAQAPNGVADSTTITFVPKPVSLAKVSGDTQTAAINAPLANPFKVQVKAADSLGVAGVRLIFHPLGFAGPVTPDTIYTDSLGFAQASATLSDSVGMQQWQVTGTGLTPVTFSATAQVLAGPPFKLKLITPPADTQVNGTVVVPSPVVQIEDSAGIPVHHSGLGVTARTFSYLTGAPRPIRLLPKGARRAPSGGPFLTAATFGVVDDTSDAQGKVTFSGLRLSGYGADRIVFNSDSLALRADTSLQLFVKQGPPKMISKASVDSSSSLVDSLVSVPPAVYVYDTTFNPVPNVPVVFQITAGGGQLPKPVDTVFTDTTGRAQLASWRLGAIAGTNSVQATVAGVGSITFTAFAQPPVPTVLLQLQGTSVVGVGRSATLLIRLSSPASAADTLYVTSSNANVVTVTGSPVVLVTGDTLKTVTLNGIGAGTDTVTATATGYVNGTIPIVASVNLISLPASFTVPFGGTASVAVTLAAPAPAGGVVVTLSSSDSTKVGVMTPTISFAQGVQSQNGQVSGVAIGTATITASNPNYASATSTAATSATLNIVNSAATIYPAFPDTQAVQFTSAGGPIAAPVGGIAVSLSSSDTTCVKVPVSTLISAGLSSANFQLSYGGTAKLLCNATVTATAAGLNPDSIAVTVNPPPTIATGTLDVGAGLQAQVSLFLQTPTQGTSAMTIRPLRLGIARFAPNLTTAGVDTLSIPLTAGTSSLNAVIAGMDTVVNDSTFVEVSIPGYAVDTALVRVRQPALYLYGVLPTTTTFSPANPIYAYIGVPYAGSTTPESYQGLRVGHAPVTVTFHVTPGSVAKLTDSSGVLDTIRTAPIPVLPSVYYTVTSIPSGGVGYHPIAAGISVTTATAPGFVSAPTTDTTTVSAPTLSASAPQVGAGLETSDYVGFSAPTPGPTTLTIRSLKPTAIVVADSVNHVGADSAKVPLSASVSSASIYVAGIEGVVNDSAQLILSIPGYATDTIWAFVRQAGVVLLAMPTSTTTLTPRSSIYAAIGLPYAGSPSMQAYQPIRAGGSPLTVTFHTLPASVGKLVDSAGVQDTVRTAIIPAAPLSGVYYTPTNVTNAAGVAYVPIGPGTSTTWATATGYRQLSQDTVMTTVTAPIIGIQNYSVGSGLQYQSSVSFQTATPGADTLILKSLKPSILKLSPNDSTPGTDSLVVPLVAGTPSYYFYVQGLEGVTNDSATVSATLTGYAPATSGPFYVIQPGVQLANVNTTTTTLSDSNAIWVLVGIPYSGNTGLSNYEAVRAGSPGASFTVKVSNPNVQKLVTSTGQADSVVVTVQPRQYYSATSVATGGMALKTLTTGTDTVTVTGPPYAPQPTATQAVVVSAPGITVTPPYAVGSGLSVSSYAVLGASNHGGVTVTIKSSNPGVMLVAPDNVTPGTDSIHIFVANGQTFVPFYVIGVDSQVGSPIVTASANGFTDGTTAVPVVQPIIDVYGLNTTPVAAGADNPFYAPVGVPYTSTSYIYQAESRAAGAAPLTVTFTSSAPTVGTLVTNALTAGVVSAVVGPTFYYTPLTVASGGAAFRPLTAGATTVSASIPGFLQTANAAGQTVTVSP